MPLDDTLAERLYIAWRERMEFVEPLASAEWRTGRSRVTRPPWHTLTTLEQSVWKHVAEAAAGVLVDAMGAA